MAKCFFIATFREFCIDGLLGVIYLYTTTLNMLYGLSIKLCLSKKVSLHNIFRLRHFASSEKDKSSKAHMQYLEIPIRVY